MRPGEALAQGENAVRERKGLVGADAEFAAYVGDVTPGIGQREIAGAHDRLFGIGRQIEGYELRGGVRRNADAAGEWRDEAVTALKPSRIRIRVKLGAEPIEAGSGHGAVGGDVLPAI